MKVKRYLSLQAYRDLHENPMGNYRPTSQDRWILDEISKVDSGSFRPTSPCTCTLPGKVIAEVDSGSCRPTSPLYIPCSPTYTMPDNVDSGNCRPTSPPYRPTSPLYVPCSPSVSTVEKELTNKLSPLDIMYIAEDVLWDLAQNFHEKGIGYGRVSADNIVALDQGDNSERCSYALRQKARDCLTYVPPRCMLDARPDSQTVDTPHADPCHDIYNLGVALTELLRKHVHFADEDPRKSFVACAKYVTEIPNATYDEYYKWTKRALENILPTSPPSKQMEHMYLFNLLSVVLGYKRVTVNSFTARELLENGNLKLENYDFIKKLFEERHHWPFARPNTECNYAFLTGKEKKFHWEFIGRAAHEANQRALIINEIHNMVPGVAPFDKSDLPDANFPILAHPVAFYRVRVLDESRIYYFSVGYDEDDVLVAKAYYDGHVHVRFPLLHDGKAYEFKDSAGSTWQAMAPTNHFKKGADKPVPDRLIWTGVKRSMEWNLATEFRGIHIGLIGKGAFSCAYLATYMDSVDRRLNSKVIKMGRHRSSVESFEYEVRNCHSVWSAIQDAFVSNKITSHQKQIAENGIQRVEKYIPDQEERENHDRAGKRPSGHFLLLSDYLDNDLRAVAHSQEYEDMTPEQRLDFIFNISTQMVNIFSVLHQCFTRARKEKKYKGGSAEAGDGQDPSLDCNRYFKEIYFVHGDIKRQNVALTKKGQIKIIDFDRSSGVHGRAQLCGTACFESPDWHACYKCESFEEMRWYKYKKDEKADVWAIGQTIMRMIEPVSTPEILLRPNTIRNRRVGHYSELHEIFGLPSPLNSEAVRREIRDPRTEEAKKFREERRQAFKNGNWAWEHVKNSKGIKEFLEIPCFSQEASASDKDNHRKVTFLKQLLTHFLAFDTEDRYTAQQFRCTYMMDFTLNWKENRVKAFEPYSHAVFKVQAEQLIERYLVSNRYLHEDNRSSTKEPGEITELLTSPSIKLVDYSKDFGLLYEVAVPHCVWSLEACAKKRKREVDWNEKAFKTVKKKVPVGYSEETMRVLRFQIGSYADTQMMLGDYCVAHSKYFPERTAAKVGKYDPYKNTRRILWNGPDFSDCTRSHVDPKTGLTFRVTRLEPILKMEFTCPFCHHSYPEYKLLHGHIVRTPKCRAELKDEKYNRLKRKTIEIR